MNPGPHNQDTDRPKAGRRTGPAISGESGLKGRTDADRREYQEIRPRRMRFKTLGIPRPTRGHPSRSCGHCGQPAAAMLTWGGRQIPICGSCQAKLDGPEMIPPWCAFNEVHPKELREQVPTAGILVEARLLPIVDVPSQR